MFARLLEKQALRLGAPIDDCDSPESWLHALHREGYRAAYCPIDADADASTRLAYRRAADEADITIAEVGVWNNPLSLAPTLRKATVEHCQRQLDLADELGATCCVNIAGSRHPEIWDAPHADNFSEDTFAWIVDTVREIIDAVRPKTSLYTLEPMPYLPPDSPESYLRLIRAIDRPAFGVHLDLVNWVNSPTRYFKQAALIHESFDLLGPHITVCHVKDIWLEERPPVHFREVPPGEGAFDHLTFLTRAAAHPKDLPLMLEHLDMNQYPAAARFMRSQAQALGLEL